MTNTDRIMSALDRHGPLTDAELRKLTGVEPHQQVNQICRRLAAEGRILRAQSIGGGIVNQLVSGHTTDGTTRTPAAPSPPPTRKRIAASATMLTTASAQVDTARCLFVIPCSGRKAGGGRIRLDGPSVIDMLPAALASRLAIARAALAPTAHVDESRLLPAEVRYTGNLYATAGSAIQRLVAGQPPVVIISGGYGLVAVHEPIGSYDRRFALSDWPRGLLEDCLVAIAAGSGVERIVAFCSRTTSYAQLVRGVRWGEHGLQASLITPIMAGRGGAQVLVPRATGEALIAAFDGHLESPSLSTDGVEIRVEALP